MIFIILLKIHCAIGFYDRIKRKMDEDNSNQEERSQATPSGEKGSTGVFGTGIERKGTVQSYTDLPNTANRREAWFVRDDNLLYIWGENGFPAQAGADKKVRSKELMKISAILSIVSGLAIILGGFATTLDLDMGGIGFGATTTPIGGLLILWVLALIPLTVILGCVR